MVVLKSHKVPNHALPLTGLLTGSLTGKNAYSGDPLIMKIAVGFPETLHREFDQIGRYVLSPEAQELARLANSELPKLKTHDRQGQRIDQVEYHPAYHALMRRSVGNGLHCSIWEDGAVEAGRRHQARAIRFYLTAQLEAGHLNAMTMTSASLAALMSSADLYQQWLPRIMSRKYDQSHKAIADKSGITLGLAMTEKQGGTDLSVISSEALRFDNDSYLLNGHKWFLSAPMSDAFLVLAQLPEGLSCFLATRVLADGSLNGFMFQRLKDKLGNCSNATAEVEFDNVHVHSVGKAGEGIKTITDMLTLTRLDCAVASAGLMHAGLAEAIHHTRSRYVSGEPLIEKPLMQRVMADMALDVAAATALSMRLARAFDMAANDRQEASFARAMTPVVKYWVSKIAPSLLSEAMEALGGNGYVEENYLSRLYREAPFNTMWEGGGNVMALDVARVLVKAPKLFDEVLDWVARQLGRNGQGTINVLRAAMQLTHSDEGAARLLTEQLALAAAAAELRYQGLEHVADAFIETRLGGQWRTTYGMLDARHNARHIIDMLYPAV